MASRDMSSGLAGWVTSGYVTENLMVGPVRARGFGVGRLVTGPGADPGLPPAGVGASTVGREPV
jgi:hypothetical protein